MSWFSYQALAGYAGQLPGETDDQFFARMRAAQAAAGQKTKPAPRPVGDEAEREKVISSLTAPREVVIRRSEAVAPAAASKTGMPFLATGGAYDDGTAAGVVAAQNASSRQIRDVEEQATGMTPPLEQRTTFIQQPSIAQRAQRVSPLAQSWQLPLQLQPPAFSIGRSSGTPKNLAFYGVAAAVGLAAIWLITRGE